MRFVLGDIHDPIHEGVFDAVVCRLVLMFVPEPAAVLRTQATAVRPGGIVAAIENDVFSTFDNEIESRRLGELVMDHLRDLDQVAFVRFASVYRQFEDAGDFFNELQPFLAEGPIKSPK